MNADALLAHYERIVDTPDAIVRLRRFVLELAVRGKLVPQDPEDEGASELLARTRKHRASLEKIKKIKPATLPYGPIAVGEDFELPGNWVRSTIAEMCDLQTGATPDRARNEFFGGEIPWLVSGDVKKGEIFECDGRITTQGLNASNCKILPEDSVLIALNGQGKTRATVAILRMRAACNQSLVAIIPLLPECLSPEYLCLNLRSRYKPIRELTGQDERRGLNMRLISCFEISFPPLAEQHRIVAKVDELMAFCDRLEAARSEREAKRDQVAAASLARLNAPDPEPATFADHARFALDNFAALTTRADQVKQLRQTILNLAVRGKLVPQDPNDEPASELLMRIAAEKEQLIKARAIKKSNIEPVALAKIPFSAPCTWAWTRLGSIGDWGSGSTPPRGRHELYGGGITWLKSGELNDNRALCGSEETVTDLALASGTFRLNQPGDVLIAMYGATIGKVAILAEKAVTNQAVCGCTPFKGVFNEFLFLFLLSHREQFRSLSEGGAQPNISKVKIVGTPFPLPPLAEQERIVARVNELMGLCDRLEASLTLGDDTRRRLLEALLAEALTPGEGLGSNESDKAAEFV